MKHRLTPIPEQMLLKDRLQQRATIAALNQANIDNRSIAIFTETHPKTVFRWVCRIEEGKPLTDAKRSGRPRHFSESARLMTIAVYCQHSPPLPGVHQWSLRDAQAYFKEHPETLGSPISHATIQRILLEHALRPHRQKYYLQITDPDFFPKMEHVIGLYSNPPRNLYCFDECTCIQALKRLTPTLPPDPNQPALEDFDYRRNGTTDLLAFLNPATGKVYGQCTENHNRHTLCEVFSTHVGMHSPDAVIHYVMDNLGAHYHNDFCRTVAELSKVPYTPLKTGIERRQWLQSPDKRIVVHFVPFHASWLNMVEIWFGILKRKCLKHDQFFSVEQLREAIMAFIETWNEFYAHPFNWSYTGAGLHEKAVRRFSRLLSIETDQMDAKFLTGQLLLMSNLAEKYLNFVPQADWLHFIQVATDKAAYIRNIVQTDTRPRGRIKTRQAYNRFIETVIKRKEPLAEAA
ncbi:MAG: IS630 family transposase [Deltaproteobacteria bacterium]|nr:MAG: IS630 family transposase [Deltaproteobacteria bacterium]